MTTRISGVHGTITLDTDPVVTAQSSNISISKNVLTKQFIGQTWQSALGGQMSATFSASGAVTKEGHDALLAAVMAGSIPASLQLGEALGATDAGLYNGTLVVGNLGLDVSGDGEWEFSLDGTFHGAVTHTPAGP